MLTVVRSAGSPFRTCGPPICHVYDCWNDAPHTGPMGHILGQQALCWAITPLAACTFCRCYDDSTSHFLCHSFELSKLFLSAACYPERVFHEHHTTNHCLTQCASLPGNRVITYGGKGLAKLGLRWLATAGLPMTCELQHSM
jgi:hypothetical protein